MCGMQESPVRPVEVPRGSSRLRRGQGVGIPHAGDLACICGPISPPAAAARDATTLFGSPRGDGTVVSSVLNHLQQNDQC